MASSDQHLRLSPACRIMFWRWFFKFFLPALLFFSLAFSQSLRLFSFLVSWQEATRRKLEASLSFNCSYFGLANTLRFSEFSLIDFRRLFTCSSNAPFQWLTHQSSEAGLLICSQWFERGERGKRIRHGSRRGVVAVGADKAQSTIWNLVKRGKSKFYCFLNSSNFAA